MDVDIDTIEVVTKSLVLVVLTRMGKGIGHLYQERRRIFRMSSKICTKCGRELPATTEFFSPNPTGKFGLYSICRKCKQPIDCERRKTRDKKKELEQKKEYYYKNRDRLNSLAKLHNRIREIKVKQQTCTICNEQKKLQLASIGHTYTENPKDYMWLCQSCHHLYDSSRGEKELPNRENGLNHSYGINGEPNVHHSKLPETEPEKEDYELWGVPGYDDCNMKIPVKYADVIRINLSYIKEKQKKELIEEFLEDIKRINNGLEPYPNDPLDLLTKKWQGRIK